MKHTILFTLSSLVITVFMAGCSSQIATAPGLSSSDREVECANIDKKLRKVDKFLTILDNTSAFHLAEADLAMQVPSITESNNKPRMIKDANQRKSELLAEHQKLGCEATQE